MLIGRSDLGEVLKRRISISIMERSTKTSWDLTCTIMAQGIMMRQLVDG